MNYDLENRTAEFGESRIKFVKKLPNDPKLKIE